MIRSNVSRMAALLAFAVCGCLLFVTAHGARSYDEMKDDPTEFREAFKKINSLLVNKEESADGAANLKAAKDLYETFASSQSLQSPLMCALRLFMKLGTVLEPSVKCTPQAVDILGRNDLANYIGSRRIKDSTVGFRRMDKVIYEFVIKHSKECTNQYPKHFEAMQASLATSKAKADVDKIFDKYLPDTDDDSKIYEFIKSKSFINKIGSSDTDSVFLQQKLNEISAGDKDHKYASKVEDEEHGGVKLNREKFSSLFKMYLLKPCKDYTTELEPVFGPAVYDLGWQHEVIEGEPEYYKTMARFYLCKQLDDMKWPILQRIYSVFRDS